MEKRLRKLEEAGRVNAVPNLDRNAAVQSFIADCIKRNSDMLFKLWRTDRLAAGLPAEQQDYDDEKAADEAAWHRHFASLPPNERAELGKSELDKALARLTFKHRYFSGA